MWRSFPCRCTQLRRVRRNEGRGPMLQLTGPPALSAFRIVKLLERLRLLEPAIAALDARFMHFVDLAQPLTASERAILAQLLTYGPRLPERAHSDGGEPLLVMPRTGTISPWSSKATDIAHVCGLTAIRRIERGIAYRLRDTRPLGPERLAAVAPVLFDRMTEMVLFNPEHAQRLFDHAAPKPLVSIDRNALESANRELGLALSAD